MPIETVASRKGKEMPPAVLQRLIEINDLYEKVMQSSSRVWT